jgi:hypothetical protein
MWADYLREATKLGQTVWEWRAWDHLEPDENPISFVQNERSEWTHGNAVSELPDGNLLVSFRNISTVVKIDRSSGRVVWKLGAPTLSGQHAPVELPNGNILMFDNGPTRLNETFLFSRVIEVNPATNEIVCKYQDANPQSFYSDRISNVQRLPNGNTLINEGMFGRFFEVTPAGEVVWEYVNPLLCRPIMFFACTGTRRRRAGGKSSIWGATRGCAKTLVFGTQPARQKMAWHRSASCIVQG